MINFNQKSYFEVQLKAATNTSEVFSGTLADLKIGGLVATSIDGATVDGGSYIGS